MSATSYDWSRFTVRININAAGKILYDAWATKAGMEYWFLRLSEYKKQDGALRGDKEQVQKGDGYKWLWHGWPDDTVEYGTILECNGLDLLNLVLAKLVIVL